MIIQITPQEIVTALSYGSEVIAVTENHFKREAKRFIGLPINGQASSEDYASFYTPRRGFKRIECQPSEAYLAYRAVIAA
jgi:hypothetical protein